MAKRTDPFMITKLFAIQELRQSQADAALALARTEALRATENEDRARDAEAASHADWSACLGRTGFAPELSRALAAELVCRQSDVTAATVDARDASVRHGRAQAAWCLAEARVELTRDALTGARRDARKHLEEKRMSALSDRVTYDWSRG